MNLNLKTSLNPDDMLRYSTKTYNEDDLNPELDLSLSETLITKIEEFINEKFYRSFVDKSELNEILDETQNLIADLYLVQTKVVPCFPPKYNIFNVYKDRYLKNVYDRISPYMNESYLSENRGNLILFAKWLDQFNENLKKVGIDIKATEIGSVKFYFI